MFEVLRRGSEAPGARDTATDIAWRIAREVDHVSRASHARSPWHMAPALRTPGAMLLLLALA